MTGLVHFSVDAASNDTAAPPINFLEGQAAASVNNSMREVMAALARYHADLAGGLAATGAAGNALFVATNQVFVAADLAKPFEVAFRAAGTNSAPATLSVDATAAKSLRRPDGTILGPGDLVDGPVYRVRRDVGGDRYVVVSPAIEPAGRIAAFGTEAAIPSGWAICDGRAVSRTAYAALFAAIGTAYGAGNGTSTFNLPDINGRALFGADNQGGTDAGRLSAAGGISGAVGSAGGSETVTLTVGQMPAHGHAAACGNGGGVAERQTGLDGGHTHGTETNPGETGAEGGHTHGTEANPGETGAAGAATPEITVEDANQHGHVVRYTTLSGFQAGGGLTAVTAIYDGTGSYNEAGRAETANAHTHQAGASGIPNHRHAISTAPNHRHTIPAVDNHRHTIPAIDPHDHTVTVEQTGGGNAHPNMPPGLCVIYAIKT